ncbi:MAG: cytochrome c oxidase subunit II [Planctomycetes bacterium]|nr:cytochrome c oxidase subunit II [Planctomycetota bacterium]
MMTNAEIAGVSPVLGAYDWFSNWGLPENISTYGGDIDRLWAVILVITGILLVVTEFLLAWTVFRYRAKKGRKAAHVHGHHRLQVTWTVATGAVLLFLAIYQARTWAYVKARMPDPDGEDVLVVQVAAQQFEWNFRYAGDDGEFGTEDDVALAKKLHIPVGKKILFVMRSKDVIHSLFLPQLRFKQDLLPGVTVQGWVEATKTTEKTREEQGDPEFQYEIACAEICGMNHHEMRGFVIIHPEATLFEAQKPKDRKDPAAFARKFGDYVDQPGMSFADWALHYAESGRLSIAEIWKSWDRFNATERPADMPDEATPGGSP